MKHSVLFIVNVLTAYLLFGQNEDRATYRAERIIDPTYGITMYEPLNIMLGSDSIRNNKNGYALNGFEEDYYESGKLLHKGYYVNGQLKVYKNYYPNGNIERNFRLIDFKKSKLTLFYASGVMKSDVLFVHNQALEWKDYFPNGSLEFEEKYHKSFEYYISKASYYENGTSKSIMELKNKKKLEYDQVEYFANGQIKEQGKVIYNRSIFDYQRVGTWKLFDKQGNENKTEKYVNGKLQE